MGGDAAPQHGTASSNPVATFTAFRAHISVGPIVRGSIYNGPPQPGQQIKFTVGESCDRIKEEFNFLQAQYHNLKLECEKLASEKIEIQRHYVMYYEMSYGLNVEMHKQRFTSDTLALPAPPPRPPHRPADTPTCYQISMTRT
ncbi:unnamed protein product [Plutella xylostella]|uniref:(diamondback moth) hypothetical protein n=1 Tax=Plutella xylostella TaxID=51655 RepID=A0A8S4FWG2_PLUXY|nr:unnamed protein product [Plutella xylostella]